MKRIAIQTLGCRLNYAESSMVGEKLRKAGHRIVEPQDDPDMIIINSCTVTNTADRECRQLIRRALRDRPDRLVVVTGCYAQLKPEEIASIDGVDYVVGASEKFRLDELITSFDKVDVPLIHVGDVSDAPGFGPAFSSEGDARTRAFLKIQDGCNYNCSFCTIPLARGKSRSQPVEEIVEQARELVNRGYAEIVLTGVNTGDYSGQGELKLIDVLRRLHDVDGLRRLRVSSIEPNLLTQEIIDLTAESDRMLPHFHVPLQSGSDTILGAMRRRYRTEQYRSRIESIITALPDCGIGIDVIAGFPGETTELFEETVSFLENLPAQYLHVFTYSERDNTPARSFDGRVPTEERRRRTQILRMLSEQMRGSFASRFVGKSRSVLFEKSDADGRVLGYTDNYVRVEVADGSALQESIADVTIGEWNGSFCPSEIAKRV